MAQFLELCGSVGLGCRLAKTVVVGADEELMNQILFVLSYFVRCSNVETKPIGSKFFYRDLNVVVKEKALKKSRRVEKKRKIMRLEEEQKEMTLNR